MFTLSIILNLHQEGKLAQQTITNLKNILRESHSWNDVEVIAILDNPDEITKKIVYTDASFFTTIEEVNYKDLGDSRNHGVRVAKNEFIVFADGDDYCSHNMLQALYERFFEHYRKYESIEQLSKIDDQKHIAIFPELLIEFPNLFRMHYVDSNDFIISNNRFTNCYTSKIATSKAILQKYQIRKNTPPYGYEDWDLNNRLLSKGVQYKTATYRLYYRKENSQSLLQKQIEQKHIVKNSSIYNYAKTFTAKQTQKNTSQPLTDPIYLKPKSNLMKKYYADLLFEKDKNFLDTYQESYQYRQDITQWSTFHLSNQLSPQSLIYNALVEFLKDKEIIYFVPWINLGGADKVIIEYIKSIASNKVGLVTTINPGSRINKLEVPFLDLPSIHESWDHVSKEDKLHILTKAIINSKIKIVHVINSDIALQTIKYYDKVYKEHNIRTVVSFFCPDYDWINDRYHGYPVMYPEIFENTDMILSDNNYWYNYFKTLNDDYEFAHKKLSSPTDISEIKYLHKKEPTKKILWASRICNQKLFGVFEEIVQRLPEYQFIIYGGKPEEEHNKEILERLLAKPNFEFRGEYQHISELVLDEFDLYLFTSLFEGIPTIILDMAISGIPIVSADVGGISEVLGQDYSLLVKDARDSQAYIDKINEFYLNKTSMTSKMKEIREYIIEEHNEKTFQKEYQTIIKGLLDGHR